MSNIPLKQRCKWVTTDQIYIDYHDQEWGVPIYDARALFEFLLLEGNQAGLSWLTILKRRDNYREAFDHFNPEKIARYDDKKIQSLLHNEGIIRNRLKIHAAVTNAQLFLEIQEQGDFVEFIWQFVDGQPIQNNWKMHAKVPASTQVSDGMSKELKKRGFKFVGSTICYAYMQAVGMVNDHICGCFRHGEIANHKI